MSFGFNTNIPRVAFQPPKPWRALEMAESDFRQWSPTRDGVSFAYGGMPSQLECQPAKPSSFVPTCRIGIPYCSHLFSLHRLPIVGWQTNLECLGQTRKGEPSTAQFKNQPFPSSCNLTGPTRKQNEKRNASQRVAKRRMSNCDRGKWPAGRTIC